MKKRNLLLPLLCVAAALPANANLVGHFTFEDPADLAKESAIGNDGTLFDAPTAVAGRVGSGAISFDEAGRFTAPNATEWLLADTISVAFWYKTDALAEPQNVVRHDGHFTPLQGHDQGRTVLWDEPGFSGITTVNWSTDAILDNEWHHAAVVWDAGELNIYQDGSSITTEALGFTALETGTTNPWVFGNNVAGNEGWAGSLDEIRIYDHALSPAEVSVLAVPEPSTTVAIFGVFSLSTVLFLRRRRR